MVTNLLRERIYPLAWRVLTYLGSSKVDYYAHYARRDLDKRYKILVGCSSAEEFDQSAERTLRILVSLGLKPDSKILDLGCGPGRLAPQFLKFLDDKGEYYGCDISAHAINFCKEHYVRANLHFFESKMTEIPLPHEKYFDFVLCYSVFTHLFPNEMRALLCECRRLLKGHGLMLSTFNIAGRPGAWLSRTKTYFGNRDRMEYDEGYLHRILEDERIDGTEAPPIIRGPHLVLRFR